MDKYLHIDIYYYSGTGNSLRASEWMLDVAAEKGLQTRIRQIKDGMLEHEESSKALIGFVYPTHGFNAVPAMLKFLYHFPKVKGSKVFFANCRAGMKIGRLYVPGLSGLALIIPAIIMLLKGFQIKGVFSFDPPSNWTSVHPGYGPKTIDALLKRTKLRAEKYMNLLLDGKSSFKRMIIDFPIDVAISPITVAYYCFGRFFLAKTFIHTPDCTECGICSMYCPVDAIEVKNGKPYWTYNCESCMRCLNVCPHNAVQSSHLIFFGGIVLTSIPFTISLINWFPQLQIIDNYWMSLLIDNLIAIFLFFGLYRLIHGLLGHKYFGLLFKYTALTTYWRRYNLPGLKTKELK